MLMLSFQQASYAFASEEEGIINEEVIDDYGNNVNPVNEEFAVEEINDSQIINGEDLSADTFSSDDFTEEDSVQMQN